MSANAPIASKTEPEPAAPEIEQRDAGEVRKERILSAFERYAIIVVFIVMIGVFVLINPAIFGTWLNAKNILAQTSVILILAAGLTIVLSTGEFDLSFPGVILISGVVAAKILEGGGSATVAVIAAIAVAVAAEFIAGVLVAMQRTSSFIVTLALNTLWSGLAAGLSNGGEPINVTNQSFIKIATDKPLGLPLEIYIAIVITLIAGFLLRFTVFGRHAAAIGTNPIASRFAGLRLASIRIATFSVLGVCAGVAAVILTARQAQFTSELSLGLFIPPFVAAFFGISVLAAGRFNIFGTLIGALFVSTLETGLIISGAQAWTGELVVGAVLIITLFAAAQARRRDA
jgi:ribose/xylose/arabinose/galactoside ABC-type transport system permease subunit